MFYIKLPRPIYLISELAPVAKSSGINIETIEDILECRCYVVKKNSDRYHRGAVVPKEIVSCVRDTIVETGQEGVDIICEKCGIKPRMLEKIELAADIYSCIENETWKDIEYLIWRAATESERALSLRSIGVTDDIYKSAVCTLWKSIEALAGGYRFANGPKKFRSLADVSYSLLDGWSGNAHEKRKRELCEIDKIYRIVRGAEKSER